MLPRYENRVQLALALLVGLLLLANLFTLTLVALAPATRASRAPVLFTVFIITLVVSVPSILLIPRWLLRPYRQLLDEAERAPVSARSQTRDETEFVLEAFQDVVAQLRAKQRELERLSAQARQRAASAERFSERIVASVPSGLVAFDAGGRVTIANPPARALLDASDEAEGQHFRQLLARAPELAAMVERCLESGELYRREEVMLAGEGGRARRLGATVAPIDPQAEATTRGALCLITDITEVVQLRETVALKRSLESLGEMSAGLAHEFKNALATLHGYAQLLQNLSLDERGRTATSALLQEVRSLTEMVTAFLNFARPQPLQPVEVSLKELVADCAAELEALYSERRVSIRVEGELSEVRADERMLRQSVLNLLRNAAEAIGEESEVREVRVRGAELSDAEGRRWAQLEIEDTGEGIPAGDVQRIFIPFFTTKQKGHGIGLALAYRVVTEHGGSLSAANSTRGGALFTLRLPL